MKTLTPQQIEVINHVRRFRPSTNLAVERVFNQTQDAARSIIRRLREAGVLDEAQLFGRKSYFFLTKSAARSFFSDPSLGGALGPLALARQFGMLSFCCLDTEPREKITRIEFLADFPELATRGLQHDYYFLHEFDSQTRLGYIHVDTGSDYQRLERKIRMNVIGKRRAIQAWRTDVLGDELNPGKSRFSIAIVTITPEKAGRLRSMLEPELSCFSRNRTTAALN